MANNIKVRSLMDVFISIISWKCSQSSLNTSASMQEKDTSNHFFESLAPRWIFAFSLFRQKTRTCFISCAGYSSRFYDANPSVHQYFYFHLHSLPLSTDKSAKHTKVVSILLNILASHFRVWRTNSSQWRLQSTVVNLMNFYSAKTIEEYSKPLYINLKIP